jgi:hypothetical protein
MPVKRPPKAAVPPAGVRKGCYLTDISEDPKGQGLYRVLEVVELSVELENCMVPSGLPQWMPVREVLQRMRVVTPS